MTIKQKKFIANIVKGDNNTQAAIKAGYSKKTAYSIGNENLNKPEIKAEINKEIAKIQAETKRTVLDSIKRFEEISLLAQKKSDYTNAARSEENISKILGHYEVDNKQKAESLADFLNALQE